MTKHFRVMQNHLSCQSYIVPRVVMGRWKPATSTGRVFGWQVCQKLLQTTGEKAMALGRRFIVGVAAWLKCVVERCTH